MNTEETCTKEIGCGLPIYDSVGFCDRCEICGKILHQYEDDPLSDPMPEDQKRHINNQLAKASRYHAEADND